MACSDTPTEPGQEFPDEPAPSPHPDIVAFVGVNVVPMDVDRVLTDQTVIVRSDRIEALGATADVEVPAEAFRIEGRGRYLAPGLADMHVHLTSRTFEYVRNDFVLWLANGVTTVRVMWGSTGIVAERERIASGEILGPSLLVASPGIDAPGGTWTGSTPPVADADEARQRVADHAAAGYDFIKVYNDLTGEMYDAIVAEAASHGLPVVGHVPRRVGIERVQDAGQSTLEHLIGMKLRAASAFTGGTLDMPLVRSLAARSAAAGVWHTPTVSVDALSQSQVQLTQASEELGMVSPGMRAFFEEGFYHGFPSDVASREEANHEAMIGALDAAGAGLLVGTDAGFGWILPGFSIWKELRHFSEAGLSGFEVLRAATSGASRRVLRDDTFGTIAPGMRADLILTSRNPLSDPQALRESSGVMVRGRWLSRGTLNEMLDRIRADYGGA